MIEQLGETTEISGNSWNGTGRQMIPDELMTETLQEIDNAIGSGNLAGVLARSQILLRFATPNEAASILRKVGAIVLQSGDGSGSSIRIFRAPIHKWFKMRVAAPRVFAAVRELPISSTIDLETSVGMRGLAMSYTIGMDLYWTPLLSALPRLTLGFAADRGDEIVGGAFGRPIPTTTLSGMLSLADTFRPMGFSQGSSRASFQSQKIDGDQILRALKWWTTQLNLLFSLAADPCYFPSLDDDTVYDPAVHYAFLINLQRLFDCIAIIVSLDEMRGIERLGQLFDFLDIREALHLGAFKQAASPSFALYVQGRLLRHLPPDLVPIVGPRCENGVLALGGVFEEFLPAFRVERKLLAKFRDGHQIAKDSDSATSDFLRATRNLTGHGMRLSVTSRDEADWRLAMLHPGSTPSALPDLAFLYLLDLVANPGQALDDWHAGWLRESEQTRRKRATSSLRRAQPRSSEAAQ